MASVRQLAALMVTDIAGYSTLTQQDESTSVRLLNEQETLVRPLISDHGGREIKTIGDAFLVEFQSALAATQCAFELQSKLYERNRRAPPPKVELRIGIHVGDVLRRGTDVVGDTVNVVFRIAPTAETGGICVSGPVYEQVRTKVDFSFRQLEPRQLKHIDLPVSIYRVELPWSSTGSGRLTPWTGRRAELNLIREKIDSTQTGKGGVLVVSGEEGVGKSRLAEEAIKHAEKIGFRVLRGRALPGELGVPFAHWAEAVREFLQSAPPQMLYKICGAYAAEIARLVPEIVEAIGPVPPSLPVEPEQARFRFFQGVSVFFENLAKEAPLLLFFDGLQWADPASLRLLQHAAPRLSNGRLLLMAAYADSEVDPTGPLAEVLHALHRDHLLTRVRLARLDRPTTATMVTELLQGDRPSKALVATLYETTGGNPFYLEEMLRSLIDDGTAYRTPSGVWERQPVGEVELPTSIREVVQRRLNRLSEGDRRLLSAAAVLGTEFRPELLATVAGVGEQELVEPLERMLGARAITERSTSRADVSYVFTDAQLCSMLYEDLSFLRRRGYHQRAAAGLEASHRTNRDEVAAELEFHYLRGNEPEKALEYALKAAERSAKLYSHEDAVQHYRTAVEILEATSDKPRKWQTLKLLGEQELYLSRFDPATRDLREAAEGFEQSGQLMEAAELFRRVGSLTRIVYHDPATSQQHLDRARRILESQPEGKELAALYLDVADVLSLEGRAAESSELWEKGRALVERLEDHELEVRIELALTSDVPVRHKEEVFMHGRKAEAIALRYNLVDWLPRVYFSLGLDTLEIRGDTQQALEWFQKSFEAARKVGDTGFDTGVRKHMSAYVDIKRGELREASRLTDELFEFLAENFPHPPPQHLCGLSEIALLVGEHDRAEELLRLFDAQAPESVAKYCRMRTRNVLGRLSLFKRDPARAESAFATTLELFRANGPTAGLAALACEALCGLVEARLASGKVDSAQTALDELALLAQEFDEAIGHGYWYTAQGLMAIHQTDAGAAAAAFRRSGDCWRRIGWNYHLALSLYHLGSGYQASGNRAEAIEPLQQAVEMFTSMGARADAARALGILNQATP